MFETIEEVDGQVESTSADITPEIQDPWSEKGSVPALFTDITSPVTISADNRPTMCSSTISGSSTSYHENKIPNIVAHQRVRRESRYNFKHLTAKVINQSIPQILKQNRMVVARQRTVVKELRNWKNSVNVDLKEIKDSIIRLKRVNELQRFRVMRNTIQRLMKEVTELKKTRADLGLQSSEHDFEPIVPLPDEVPINTGEEHETVLFRVRAKLYRFTQEDWKERGVGYLQILKNVTTGKTRVLMRREKVHKICANHIITRDIVLIQMPNNPKVYSWAAHDIAYQTITLKKFSARFKNEREAESFRVAFERAPQPTPATPTWLNFKFKPNEQDTSKASYSSAPLFCTPVASKTDKLGFGTTGIFSVATSKNVSKTTNIFSNTIISSTEGTSDLVPFPGYGETSARRNSSFSLTSALNFNAPQISDEETMSLGFNDSHAKIPRYSEEEVVEKVDMKTGEEVLFCHRARLFWFSDGSWKQRGAGDIKIFLSVKSGKLRVLMRHDQVQNICLDHYLTPSVEYSIKDEKSWLFSVMNYLEGKFLQFCLRFKTAEIAKEFKKTIDDALKRIITLKSKDVKDQDHKHLIPEEEYEALKLPSRDCRCVMCKEGDKFFPQLSELPPKQSSGSFDSTNRSFQQLTCEPSAIDSRRKSIFANFSPRPPSVLDNFFGKSPGSAASAISTVSSFAPTNHLFSQTPTSNVFQCMTNESIFSQKPVTLSGSIFGGKMNTNIFRTMTTPSQSTSENLFASFTTASVPQGSIFGGSTAQVGSQGQEKKLDVAFASLIAATPEKPGIGKVENDYLPFSFLDTGSSVFGTFPKLEKPQEAESFEDFWESDVEMLCKYFILAFECYSNLDLG